MDEKKRQHLLWHLQEMLSFMTYPSGVTLNGGNEKELNQDDVEHLIEIHIKPMMSLLKSEEEG